MLFENGEIIDNQIDDGDPENNHKSSRLMKIGKGLGGISTKIIKFPSKVHDKVLDFVDEMGCAVGK